MLLKKNKAAAKRMKYSAFYAAQGAIETGWLGGALYQKANNMYGVKCAACNPKTQVVANPKGCEGKKSLAFNDDCSGDRFLVFDDPSESLTHQVEFLQGTSRANYAECFEKAKKKPSYKKLTAKSSKKDFHKTDLAYVCDCVASKGYATNPHYAKHLKNLIFNYDLHLKM